MPTQEERLTALEKYIQETDENITIMLGVIRHQGQDIRRIFQHLETMDEHLISIEQRLNEHTRVLSEHTGRFNRLETLLTQILERLPKTP